MPTTVNSVGPRVLLFLLRGIASPGEPIWQQEVLDTKTERKRRKKLWEVKRDAQQREGGHACGVCSDQRGCPSPSLVFGGKWC